MPSQIQPDVSDIELAKSALLTLGNALTEETPVTLVIAESQSIPLPRTVTSALLQVLEATAHGEETAILPLHSELTTGQAAAMLGVSRPYLVKLLDEDRIEHRTVGTHRRVRMSSLLDFMQRDYSERRAALDELSRETFELGLT